MEEEKRTKGLLILCGILLFLLFFLAAVNYQTTKLHNNCVEKFNTCYEDCAAFDEDSELYKSIGVFDNEMESINN